MSKTEEMKLVLSRLDGPKRTPGLLLDRALTLAFLKIIGEMSFRLACSFAIFHALIGRGAITCATAFFIVGVPCLCLMVHLSLKWHQRIVDSIVSLGLGITLGNLLLFFLVWSVILDTDLILRFAPYFVGVSFF